MIEKIPTITNETRTILQKLYERKSSNLNTVNCFLYQARHENNGNKIPAKTLMLELGGAFPKQYNSRVNKVYDWKDRKYQTKDGTWLQTSHSEYLKRGESAPSITSEYKEILAFEHRVYAAAEAFAKTYSLPDGISNFKKLAELYFLELEHGHSSEIKDAIEKGMRVTTSHAFEEAAHPVCEIDTIEKSVNNFEYLATVLIDEISDEMVVRIRAAMQKILTHPKFHK